MQYRQIGRTGLRVSSIVFGGLNFGGAIVADDVKMLVHDAWDHGVTTFYTADDYQGGNSERTLGEIVRPRRDDCVLYVKAGYQRSLSQSTWAKQTSGELDYSDWIMSGVSPNSHGHSRKHLYEALEGSLRNLQTDYIDLYAMHFYDLFTPVEETLDTLNDFVRQGKVRYIGCSQHQPHQIYEALAISDANHWPRYSTLQQGFNILERGALQNVMPALRKAGVSMFAGDNNSASGLLTSEFPRHAHELIGQERPTGQGNPGWQTGLWNDTTFDALARLQEVADQFGRGFGEMCLAWLLAQDPVVGLQVSPNPPHQYDNLAEAVAIPCAAANNPLSAEESLAIDAVLADIPISTRGATTR